MENSLQGGIFCTKVSPGGDKLKMRIGFSDHSLGISASIMALSFGASILEQHFTLHKKLKGPDHSASLSPKELIEYVREVRVFEKSIGNS